jgi:hypothetical protein
MPGLLRKNIGKSIFLKGFAEAKIAIKFCHLSAVSRTPW